jgi:hypothetical protein
MIIQASEPLGSVEGISGVPEPAPGILSGDGVEREFEFRPQGLKGGGQL